jgi:DNA-binding transcriptional MocR family regulator
VVARDQPRLLAVTPDFQNPTGGALPLAARKALIAIARRRGVRIIENDIYGDLRYEGERLPTLKQLDESGSVVLIRSFSKVAFPGLRVGWVIAPSAFAAELSEVRQWCDLHTDQLSQAVLWRFAVTCRLQEHIERVRASGAERLRTVIAACERHLPQGTEFTRPQGGMNLWIRLPGGLDTRELLPECERAGVTYLPGTRFEISHYDPSTLRLSFGGLAPERIESGVATLGRVFREGLQKERSASRLETAPALV